MCSSIHLRLGQHTTRWQMKAAKVATCKFVDWKKQVCGLEKTNVFEVSLTFYYRKEVSEDNLQKPDIHVLLLLFLNSILDLRTAAPQIQHLDLDTIFNEKYSLESGSFLHSYS